MESINNLKGYDKVNSDLDLENQNLNHSQKTRKRTLLLTISAILLLTLLITLSIASLIHESDTEPPEPHDSISSDSIKTVCNVTRYRASCFSTISSLNLPTKADPESIFKLSLQVSINELKNASFMFRNVNSVDSQGPVTDCLSLLDDALSRLNDSMAVMEVGNGEKMLTLEKMNDIQTWVSGAMADEDTCLDGLEEMGSRVGDEVKAQMEMGKEVLSNSLAIIAKMQYLLQMFDLKLH